MLLGVEVIACMCTTTCVYVHWYTYYTQHHHHGLHCMCVFEHTLHTPPSSHHHLHSTPSYILHTLIHTLHHHTLFTLTHTLTQTIHRMVEKHNADLARVLKGRELRFIMQTEDFPIVRKYV